MSGFEHSLKYRQWRQMLSNAGIQVHQIKELCTVRKKNGDVLFILLNIIAEDPNGHPLMPTVLLRGHFVSVMTILESMETGEEFVLLVAQRRVGNGEIFYEHPAGMCDEETDPREVAIRELHEETGLYIEPHQLHLLNEKPLYSSPGLLDEAGYFFYCRIPMDQKTMHQYHDRHTGDAGEQERIRTLICPILDAPRFMRNTNSLLNWFLYYQSLVEKPSSHCQKK